MTRKTFMFQSSTFGNFKRQHWLTLFGLAGVFLFGFNNSVEAKLINLGISTDTVYIEGNVGIGITAPTASLHIGTGGIKFPDGTYMTSAGVGSANALSNITDVIINADSDANSSGDMRFQIGGTDRLRINNSGAVGIGITAPAGTLHVNAVSGPAAIFTNGLVGITTATPAYNLDVNGTGNFTQPIIVGTPTGATHATTKTYVDSAIAGGAGSTVGYWIQNGTNINNSNAGNVGIGLTNPAHQLSVGVATADTQLVTIRGYSNTPANWKGSAAFGYTSASVIMGQLNNVAQIGGHNANLSAWGDLAINSGGGNVGIGITNPAYKFVVSDNLAGFAVQSSGGSPNAGTIRFGDNTGWKFHFGRSKESGAGAINTGTTGVLMTLQDNGNLGLGTTAPAYKLDITGTGQFTQPIIVGTPTGATHATTKSYVDSLLGGSSGTVGYWTLSGVNISNTNAGNVGVGLTNPTQKLQTAGNAILGDTRDSYVLVGNNQIGSIYASQFNPGFYVYRSGTNLYGMKLQLDAAGGYSTAIFASNQASRAITFGRLDGTTSDNQFQERMRVDVNSGSVGIGTSAPAGTLHVNTAAGSAAIFTNGLVGITTATPAYNLDVNGTGNFTQPIIVGTPTLGTHATTKTYVDTVVAGASGSTVGYWIQNGTNINNVNAGNVGIGTTAPKAPLHVGPTGTGTLASTPKVLITGNMTNTYGAPQLVLADSASVTKQLMMGWDASSNVGGIQAFTQAVGASPLALNALGGNVGVNTFIPSAKLHVNSGAVSNNLILEKSGGSASRRVFGLSVGGLNDSSLMITASADLNPANAFVAPLMAINAAGNIGIAVTNPVYKLDVAGTSQFTQPVIVGTPTGATHATTKSYVDSLLGGSSGTVGYWTLSGANVSNVNAGNVGIGLTNPASKLDVTGNVNIVGAANINGATLANGYLKLGTTLALDSDEIYFGVDGKIGTIGSYNLIFNTNGANERMRITNGGAVGIGTSAPAGTLHVNTAAGPAAIFTNGLVGITTATPAYNLDVNGTGQFSQPLIVATPTATNHATTKAYVDGLLAGGGWTVSGNNIYSANSGNVGIGTTNPLAKLQVVGGMIFGRTTVADLNYTATAADYIIAYTSLSVSRTVTLPTSICNTGRIITVADESGNASASRTIIIDPEGATTIIGQPNFTLVGAYNSVMLYCNGTNWFLN